MEGKSRTDLVFTGAKGAVLAVSRFRPRVFAPAVSRAKQADPSFPTITTHDTPCVNLSSCAGVWSPLAPRTLRIRPSDLKGR